MGGRLPAAALWVGFPAVLWAALSSSSVLAHTRSVSYSTIRVSGATAVISFRMPALEATRLPGALEDDLGPAPQLASYLARRLRVARGGQWCVPAGSPRRLRLGPQTVGYEWRVRCGDEAGPWRVESRVLLDVAPSHLHITRILRPGQAPVERMLTAESPAVEIAPVKRGGGPPAVGLRAYIALGVRHILSGVDHLLFVLALILIGESLGETARIVTGFTVAHSITLALAALGYAHPDAAAIQALVGLSIALVAAENLWLAGGRGIPVLVTAALVLCSVLAGFGHGVVSPLTLAGLALFQVCYFGLLARWSAPRTLRWAVAFVFGLVHGFGFAGVLSEGALAPETVVRGLLGFNLGVEIGQVAVVAALWPVLRRLESQPRAHRLTLELGSAAVLGAGVFWYVTRAYA